MTALDSAAVHQFSDYARSNICQFIGREWLLEELAEWWDQGKKRSFLLVGDPGTGKSMMTAWLLGLGPEPQSTLAKDQLRRLRAAVKAAHICRASSRNISPLAFARNVSAQFTRTVGGYREALQDELRDRINIVGRAEAGVAEAGAHLVGVSVTLDLGGLQEETAFDRGFVDPLKRLARRGIGGPLLLLVDGLDEAQSYEDSLLPRLLSQDADWPAELRLLMTTRNDPRIIKFHHAAKTVDLTSRAEQCDLDVQAFVDARLVAADIGSSEERTAFAKRLSERAAGVFLYAALVINQLLASPPVEDLGLAEIALPDGLEGIYSEYLNRELGQNDSSWFHVFEPLLGLLVVAQGDGLTLGQLRDLVGREVRAALRASRQYLTGAEPEGPFRPFHKSFSDFLLKPKIEYNIDAVRWHGHIVDHYIRRHGQDWLQCDDYGLRHLPAHLQGMDLVASAEWARLMSKGWLVAKKASSGWTGVAEDVGAVQRALHDRATSGDRVALAALLRAALVLASLRSWGVAVPPTLLWLACRDGLLSVAEAEQSAAALEPGDQSEAFALLATVEKAPGRREQLLERSLDAASEVARGKDTWRSCEGAADALGRILEPSRVPELAARLTGNEIRFVPYGLALLCARLADPAQLSCLAGPISDRLSGIWRARFLLACAERLTGDSQEGALRAALTAARADRHGIREEVQALLKLEPSAAQARAREWLSGLGPVDDWRGPADSIVADLGGLLAQKVLQLSEIEPVLEQIAARHCDEHFPWIQAQCFAGHRGASPTLSKLVRSTLAKAAKPQAGYLPSRVLALFSAGLTGEERATLHAVASTDPPDVRAIQLARILAGTPPQDTAARAELAEEARAATLLVDPPSLRMRSLLELAGADNDCSRWCADRAFEIAAGSKEALDAFHSSAMLWLAAAADPATVTAQVPKLLRLARGAGDAPSQWRLRLALVADDPEKRLAASLEAYAAARAVMPDIDAAIGILGHSIGAMPPETRREAYDEGLQWLRAEEAAVDGRTVEALERALRRADFTVSALPSDEIKAQEFWEVLGDYRALGVAVETEAAIAWKYKSRLFQAPLVHVEWFRRFEPAYLKRVKEIPFAIEYTVAYWVTCAHLAPTKHERRRFMWDGWRYLSAEKNPWKADDDNWHLQREERATGLYALATEAPWWLAAALRRSAGEVASNPTVGGARGLTGLVWTGHSGGMDRRGQQAVRQFLASSIDGSRTLQRSGSYHEAAQRAARFATVEGEHQAAAFLVSLLQDVARLPRRDALDVLFHANRPLVEIVGADAVKVALEDVAWIWP